ncbi:MAG: hypothetical protein JXB47_09885 [Anaerolineae bacterium]|nr:hypothetical protein [Anaerolineae bacterium]
MNRPSQPIPTPVPGGGRAYTTRERWTNWIALGATLLALFGGILLRDSVISESQFYEDPAAGISAMRPVGWLVDRGGDYVFRLRDPEARPFKTTLQVTVLTVGPDAEGRNALDMLTLRRAARLSGYRVLNVHDSVNTPRGPAPQMRYAFVASEPDPFLETLPAAVIGVDVVFFKSNQAIIATYQAGVDRFDAEYFRFEQFVASLRF